MMLLSICQLKQHFLDWGNMYQVILSVVGLCIASFFGWLSWKLWKKDREKGDQIEQLSNQTKYLSEQTSVLKDLLDNTIVPYLQVIDSYPIGITGTIRINFTNSGGPLYNLKETTSSLGNASFGFSPQFSIPTDVVKNADFLWSKENHVDSVIFKFEDKLKRKFSQELKLIEGTGFFEAPQSI